MPRRLIRIATRKSPLAIWQAEYIARQLSAALADVKIELLRMRTTGDRLIDVDLRKAGGKGVFVKELERALLDKKADIAVHSMKDMPTELQQGLALGGISHRGEVRDAFVSEHFARFEDLPQGAHIGTSSLRRQCQLLALRPDLKPVLLRGNVHTRLKKLKNKKYDAIILAGVGLLRLQLQQQIRHYFSFEQVLPAPGQGALGIECRADDQEMLAMLALINDQGVSQCVRLERKLSHRLGGSCHVPLAAHAEKRSGQLYLKALIACPQSYRLIISDTVGQCTNNDDLVEQVAEDLLQRGAREILQSLGVQLPLN